MVYSVYTVAQLTTGAVTVIAGVASHACPATPETQIEESLTNR